jgi:hypothetical protein
MEPLMTALITLAALEAAAFFLLLIVKNKRIKELNSEIKLYRQLTGEASKKNDGVVFVANLNNYSSGIIKRLNTLICQGYQKFMPKWPLDCFGLFINDLHLVKNRGKKDFIKNTFTYALGLLDVKILADIVTKHLKENGNFDEPNARDGLVIIMSVILNGGNASNVATHFKVKLEENINELLNSSEITEDEKVLIGAGWIKIKKMLAA